MHYNDEDLFFWVEGDSPIAEAIGAHLAACTQCATSAKELRSVLDALSDPRIWEREPPLPPAPPELLRTIDAFMERMAEEQEAAPPLCDEILTGPSAWWPQRLRTTRGAKTAAVVQELRTRVRRCVEMSPRDAEVMSTMAVALAEELQGTDYPAVYLPLVMGQALRDHAYVLSFQGRHAEAMAVIERAEGVLSDGAGAIYESARLKLVKSSVLSNTGAAEEAIALAREAAETFLRFGDRARYVNARITEGAVVYTAGAVQDALEIWRSVEDDPGLDDVGTIRMAHNIGLCLADLGQLDVAIGYLYRCVVQFELRGMTTERTRSRGVLGRSLLLQRKLREAIPILRQTAREFTDLGLPWDAGLVSLELAEALLVSDQPAEVPEICRTAIADFTRLGGTQHATAALGYLREAMRLGQHAPKLVRDARASLWRLAAQPQLFAFAPGKALVEG